MSKRPKQRENALVHGIPALFNGFGSGSIERPGLGYWNLELGIDLEFGTWCLEF
jgi:hypothetical protein